MTIPCPRCSSLNTVRNGKAHMGKQNWKCKICKRQFVEGRKKNRITQIKWNQITYFLKRLESKKEPDLSLEKIAEYTHVSRSTLYKIWKRLKNSGHHPSFWPYLYPDRKPYDPSDDEE